MEVTQIAVNWYLSETENKALGKYADKHKITKSEAVEALVRKALSQDDEAPKVVITTEWLAIKLDSLEKVVDNWFTTICRVTKGSEKLEEQIDYLQDEIDSMETKIKDEASQKLSK